MSQAILPDDIFRVLSDYERRIQALERVNNLLQVGGSLYTGSSLPTTAVDGQVIAYQPSVGIVWVFRYNSTSSSAYKWECIGGGYSEVGFASEAHIAAGINVPASFTTPLQVTVSLAGDYEAITSGARANLSLSTVTTSIVPSGGTIPTTSSDIGFGLMSGQFASAPWSIHTSHNAMAAAGVIRMQWMQNDTTSNVEYVGAMLRTRPIRAA